MTPKSLGFYGRIADRYSECRPSYPGELFDYLASLCPRRDLAWDCATGNGQAARSLATRFGRVIATDRTPEQIARAHPLANVEYRVASAEESGIADDSVDLITVAQAMHWFDLNRFTEEARRIARPGGLLAAWCYRTPEVAPAIDELINGLYEAACLGPYWPAERRSIDAGYSDIRMPFREIPSPTFFIQEAWTRLRFEAYLRTWQAVIDSTDDARASAFVTETFAKLREAWKAANRVLPVRWRLGMRIFAIDGRTDSRPSSTSRDRAC